MAIDRAAFNQGKNAQYDISIDDSGVAQTLVAKGPGAVAICLGFDPAASRDVGKYVLENVGNTLKNGTCPGFHNGVAIFWNGKQTAATLTASNAGGGTKDAR